ncbi:RidA family protein [Mumia sp. DW29H23]|uniref:RidA family protein n=1 Tax=Mumia sp. DW29H23 TaxID=3421241 RepID=UPI003D689DD2
MTSREPVSTENAPRPAGAYNQAMVADRFVFTAGFGPQDPATGEIPAGIEAQTVQTIRNLEAALVAAGSGLDLLVKTTVHLADLADWAAFDAAYGAALPTPHPVRTTVGSQLSGILVEIDGVALLRS